MDDAWQTPDLLDDAIEVAQGPLRKGESLAPLIIVERWGERSVERFDDGGLSDAKAKLGEFARTPGDEFCVLVYHGRVGHGEDAILIEHARAGGHTVQVFAQRFRPRSGRLRGFKLLGELRHVGSNETARVNETAA